MGQFANQMLINAVMQMKNQRKPQNTATEQNELNPLWDWLMAVILFLAILSVSVVMVLNFRPLYYLDMQLLDIPGFSGHSAEDVKLNYDALITYNSMFFNGPLEFPTLPQSVAGRTHFEEVKVIFVLFQQLAIGAGILAVAGIFLRRNYSKRYLRYSGWLTLILPVAVGAGIAINWDRAFVLFHELVFDNDYWLFDPATDPIIDMLPDAFFMHCAIGIVALVIFGAVICLICGRKKKTA